MKFVRMTLNYLTLRKFLQLALVAVIPSLVLAAVSTMSSISDFLVNYFDMDLSSYTSIYYKVSEFRFNNIPLYIVAIAIFVVGLTEIFGTVERDMRVGNFTLKGFFKRVNNNAYAVGLTVVLFMLSILLMGIVTTAFFLLWSVVASSIVAHILSLITTVIIFSFMIISWVNFLLLIPTMMITGQRTLACIRDSIRHTQGIYIQLIIAIIVPVFPMFLLVYLERSLDLNMAFFVDVIINILLIVYYVVLMLVIHYDITGLSREDLNPRSRYFR